MNVDQLLQYGIPPAVVELWRKNSCEALLPLQEAAVRRHDLFGTGNLLLQAPTSSGKTFVGEMAAIQTALTQKQVIYLVPLKALAEEKFGEFHHRYSDYGLRVIISTRDHRGHDRELERGDFDIAVVVYEKLAQLLVRRPERVAEIDLVIADELEILGDPERGAGTEVLMTQLLLAGCRIIGLSAVIGGADKLARWMEAELVESSQRPVELRYGVLYEGEFRYRTCNEGGRGREVMVDPGSESGEDAAIANVAAFAEAGDRSLIFVRAKHDTRMAADRIAARLELPPASKAMGILEAMEETRSRKGLLAVMAHGVAFHNADLSPEERRVVEDAFRAGEVLVLVSTSTLAVGLNLPARNVFPTTEKWRYDHRLGMPWKTPVSHMEYENMSGRAGRYGAGHDYGRSILVATSPFELELCWRRYVEGEREHIEPRLVDAPLEDYILRLVASGQCRSHSQLCEFLERTLSGRWVWAETQSRDEMLSRTRAAVHRCVNYELIQAMPATDQSTLAATPLGLAVATKGVTVETARALAMWEKEARHRDWYVAELLYAVASTPEGRKTQVLLTTWEYDEAGYVAELKARTRDEACEGDGPLAKIRNSRLQPFFEEVRAAKITLFLLDWLAQVPIGTIEERYNTMGGQIVAAATQLSWLIDAIGAIALAAGRGGPHTDRLSRLANQLPWGVSEDLVPLLTFNGPGLSRSEAIELEGVGFGSLEALVDVPTALLSNYLREDSVRTLSTWLRDRKVSSADNETDTASTPEMHKPVLVIDEGRPGEIALDNQVVALQRKQYELICLLARTPGECVGYETIYNTLWGDVFVEQSQMHYQKRTLLQRIQEVCPGREKGLIKTRNRFGYALELSPDSVVYRPAPPAAVEMVGR